MIVLLRSHLLTAEQTLLRGFVFAFCANIVMRLVLVVGTAPDTGGIVCYFILFAAFVGIPVTYIAKRTTTLRTLQFVIVYVLSLVLIQQFSNWGNVIWGGYVDAPLPGFGRSGTLPLFIITPTAIPLCFLSCLLYWVASRYRWGPVVIQDGTMCPQCGYNILGAVDRICSECGREFTYQELGTTKQGFSASVGASETAPLPGCARTDDEAPES